MQRIKNAKQQGLGLGDIESRNKKGREQRYGSGRRIAQLKLENASWERISVIDLKLQLNNISLENSCVLYPANEICDKNNKA